MKKPETGPDGLTFTDIYNGLCQGGWPIDIAWREALARGEEAILASYLEDARNAGAEDELYAAIAAAK